MDANQEERLRDRFVGAALGTFVGDALGMPVEGWPPSLIRRRFGRLDCMKAGRFPPGCYTDDTEMMIGILECLAQSGRFDPEITARNFVKNYNPQRGYGSRIHGVMARLARGEQWDRVGTDSFGNGSAMRVAPIGFFFHDDLAKLKAESLLSSRITHSHPRGLAGAVAQAAAVGLAVKRGTADDKLDHEDFRRTVSALVEDVDSDFAGAVRDIPLESTGDPDGDADMIRRLYACDVTAIGAVPPAIAAFLLTDHFRAALILAVNIGGDADTIGAMAGAIAGGYYGVRQFPDDWVEKLENGEKGKDYVVALAHRVADLFIEERRLTS